MFPARGARIEGFGRDRFETSLGESFPARGAPINMARPSSPVDAAYDAVLVVSFGGPEGPEDVIPFLENVLRGKNVPRERLLEVAENYQQFGGVSPINAQNRRLVADLTEQLQAAGRPLPVYWGNRNWQPLLPDTVRQMAEDGVRRALAFVTSAYSSYSGCRQYLEDIERARQAVGPDAPQIEKLRAFFNHPGFIEPQAEALTAALAQLPGDRRPGARVIFTAHSIPAAMAANCDYEAQLTEACRLVAGAARHAKWRLVYQSRSGPPSQPWLEPDVCDYLRDTAAGGDAQDVVIVPIGFLTDHIEVLYDLDTEARAVCEEVGLNMIRVPAVGAHRRFARMVVELIEERIAGRPRLALGAMGPRVDVCPAGCCPSGRPSRA
jgi:ferrochelatase